MTDSQTGAEVASLIPADLDTSVAHPARIYDYWLGGKDNFAVDREAAEQAIAANPFVRPGVRANRGFLRRAVKYLTAEAAIRQLLDIGTGLPSANNTHEVAQRVAAESRVVYVDNDRCKRVVCTRTRTAGVRSAPDHRRPSGTALAGLS